MKYGLYNGCSFMWGDELIDPLNTRFSRLMCDDLGIEEINLSIKGASNSRIYRTTIDYLTNCETTPEYVIIAWSGIDRFEFLYPYKQDKHDDYYMQCSRSRLDQPEFAPVRNSLYGYVKDIASDPLDCINTLTYMNGMQLLCSSMNIPLIQIQFAHVHRQVLSSILNEMTYSVKKNKIKNYIKSKVESLHNYSRYGLTNEMDLLKMASDIKDVDIWPNFYGHPRERSQIAFKDFMIDKLKEHYDFRVQ